MTVDDQTIPHSQPWRETTIKRSEPVHRRWNPDEALIDKSLPMPPFEGVSPETGGRKDDAHKLRWDLLPVRPMENVVEVYTIGAKKYADRNWEKGISYCRIFAAMMRHSWAWFRGETYDKADGQHHLASVVWCALALMQYERTRPEFDDRVIEPRVHICPNSVVCPVCGRSPETGGSP